MGQNAEWKSQVAGGDMRWERQGQVIQALLVAVSERNQKPLDGCKQWNNRNSPASFYGDIVILLSFIYIYLFGFVMS